MRYLIHLSYDGTSYAGWQKQPGAATIQQTLDEAFSTVLRQPVELVGCGRTDAGVHARDYVAHFDADPIMDTMKVMYQVNSILPPDIAVHTLSETHAQFHARFDAIERGYSYSIHFEKDPFAHKWSYYLSTKEKPDPQVLQAVAEVIMRHDDFLPFCKTGADNFNFKCKVTGSEWRFDDKGYTYFISANRFLRGMVRLIVGTCLNAGFGKISLKEIEECLQKQKPLPIQWSVPPEGLFFNYAHYPA